MFVFVFGSDGSLPVRHVYLAVVLGRLPPGRWMHLVTSPTLLGPILLSPILLLFRFRLLKTPPHAGEQILYHPRGHLEGICHCVVLCPVIRPRVEAHPIYHERGNMEGTYLGCCGYLVTGIWCSRMADLRVVPKSA